jgi:hypothetical protein
MRLTMNALTRPSVARWLWLVPGAAGLAVTALIMLVLPPDRTLHGFGDFVLKVSPLVLAVPAIALFPRRSGPSLVLVLLSVVVYLGYVDSASVIQVSHLADAAAAGRAGEQFDAFYRFSIFVNAFTVLSAVFAYRMGGADTARVLKLGGAAVLLLISGLNDLTMWAMYPWPGGERPAVFSWASHVAIFFGHVPSLAEMLLFLAAHLLLAAVVLVLPLRSWLDRAAARVAPRDTLSEPLVAAAGQGTRRRRDREWSPDQRSVQVVQVVELGVPRSTRRAESLQEAPSGAEPA